MELDLPAIWKHLANKETTFLELMVLTMQDPSVRIQDSGPHSVMIVSDYCLSRRRKQPGEKWKGTIVIFYTL